MSATDPGVQELRPAQIAPVRSPKEAAQTVFAWWFLVMVDIALKLTGFERFYRMVRAWPTLGEASPATRSAVTGETCAAVDRARAYYLKRAWCLQSAAAAVCFLRLRGVRAELVIGVQKIPFYAHAWAEVEGTVVNNAQPEMHTRYTVITRC